MAAETSPDAATLLIVDTCSVLDLIRAPARPSTGSTIEAATKVLGVAVTRPADLAIAITTEIAGEVKANRANVIDETGRTLRNIVNTAQQAAQEATALGLVTSTPFSASWVEDVVALGIYLAEQVLSIATVIETTAEDRDLGITRSGERLAPAQTGSSMGDCIITETCLRVAAARDGGTMLLSSNTKDYGKGTLHSPLDVEFPAAGLAFWSSWRHIAQLLDA